MNDTNFTFKAATNEFSTKQPVSMMTRKQFRQAQVQKNNSVNRQTMHQYVREDRDRMYQSGLINMYSFTGRNSFEKKHSVPVVKELNSS